MNSDISINIETLVNSIKETDHYFLSKVQKQVNTALTLRNWIIGFYIVEYEQHGNDRAVYGQKLYKQIASNLNKAGINSIRERHLYVCKDFYKAYSYILRTPSAKLYLSDYYGFMVSKTQSEKLRLVESQPAGASVPDNRIDLNLLLERLSFSHFIELLKMDTPVKRHFYEVETIRNNWSVRDLQRAMNSMLYERTGLSTNKNAVLIEELDKKDLKVENVFRNPYMLEFLGLEEKAMYTETDLEQAIINHLQNFLLELGRGFCFEARQKRITFDNTHYRIDLVFYHRILKCHVLLDLKIGEFSHADAGQMNVYLNYYRENEMLEDDNPPVGIILCASKNENLVKYATTGLPQQVFVSKYLINLPSEDELTRIIEDEQRKLN
ncbi:PDDEXK nuclease domain-containing protein [Chitinophaga sancti]|uniref:PDDEXK nuclease domain-containing protein n=1 Tax=Chitinophaga sancti TaxID=1004 RepID=UPI003F7A94F1